MRPNLTLTAVGAGAILLLLTAPFAAATADLHPEEELGKSIFFDLNLSQLANQSCASCHAPEVGWTGPDSMINAHGSVYEGSVPGRFGNRKPPTSSYATPSPILHYVMEDGEALFIGGNFWDGRATGEKLGNPAADQAQGPFLNPVEQALPDSACVVYRVCNPVVADDYPVLFEDVWGEDACDIAWPPDVDEACALDDGMVALSPEDREKSDLAYDNIALSIAAYEDSSEVNAFTSKWDAFLAREARLTSFERFGLALFRGKAKCSNCHILGRRHEPPALFTDFTFDNLGVPRNPENPVYDTDPDFVDLGLGGFLETRPEYAELAEENYGKQKVPTLRNVGLRPDPDFVKAYGHNGYFKSLKGIVHFYNTRDVKPVCPDPLTTEADALAMGCWPEPEVPENVNTDELGDLKMTDRQEDAIVAFMETLSDGWTPAEE